MSLPPPTDGERAVLDMLLAAARERYETIRTGLYRYPTASLLRQRVLVREEIADLKKRLA